MNVDYGRNVCDESFTTGPEADAYAYELSFLFGFLRLNAEFGKYPISESERLAIVEHALLVLRKRINLFPPFWGLWVETLSLVSDRGLHYYLHPFLKIPIGYTAHKLIFKDIIRHKRLNYVLPGNNYFTYQDIYRDSISYGEDRESRIEGPFVCASPKLEKKAIPFNRNDGSGVLKSDFQVENSIFYMATELFQVQLDIGHTLFVKRHYKDEVTPIDLSKTGWEIEGVGVRKALMPTGTLVFSEDLNDKEIVALCNLTIKSGRDPWTGLAMGITADYRLAFQVSTTECQVLDLGLTPGQDKVVDYQFQGSLYQFGDHRPMTKESLVVIIETPHGQETRQLYPYF